MARKDKFGAEGREKGGKGGGRRPPQTREVNVSKALSFLLRHGGKDEGITIDDGGWASVADVLHWRRLSSQQVTFAELQNLVAKNDKQRFVLEPNPNLEISAPTSQAISTADPSQWRIRASQGHSLTTLSDAAIYIPVLLTDPDCPKYLVHGTFEKSWLEIKESGGLKRMSRTHIHFADRLPKPLPPLDLVHQSKSKAKDEEDKLISGMRSDASIVVWVDVEKSLKAGIEWWRSKNGVFLTKGLEVEGKKGEWMLGLEFIKWVERRTKEPPEIILYGEKVPGVGKPEGEAVASKLGALSVNGDCATHVQEVPGKMTEVPAVVKDSWDDGDD
ncbi:hypothetical protein P7C71_g3773, partial [Lecanoromycetidae sp. Uapishka_2]